MKSLEKERAIKPEDLDDKGIHNLIEAIVDSGVKKRDRSFFFSEWFEQLMPDVDPDSLWKQIEENIENFDSPYAMVEVVDPKTHKRKLVRYSSAHAYQSKNPFDMRHWDEDEEEDDIYE